MNLITAFVQNPVKIAVGVLLVVLFGLIALTRMPIQLVPEVQRQVISIKTAWPGASPEEVEREIVDAQEEQLKGVEGVTKMSSESQDSTGTINLEFSVGTDIATALLKVNTRLQQVKSYPENADEPVIATSSSSDKPIAWMILRPRVPTDAEIRKFQQEHPELASALEPALRAKSRGLRGRRLADAAKANPGVQPILPPAVDIPKLLRFTEDQIEARLERVTGVSNANVFGGEEEELLVVVDPQRLAARRITIPELRAALALHNTDVSAGDYWEGKRRYVVRTLGQFHSPEDVAESVVARRGGVTVLVRDVADVKIGYHKPSAAVFHFGQRCLAINCVRETGANVLDVMAGIRTAIEELNSGVLASKGVQLDQAYDETEYIESAIGLVQSNIVLGGILTVLVLLIFLRSLRSTLIISLAIPTSVVGTFLLLGLMGRSLNVVSLAGMAFAVGMLVDNAIVVLENIYRRHQMGESRVDASVRGTAEVWGAVVASTLTTLAVFIPVLFLKDEVGQLFSDIALAISCAVGLSLLVSVTVIPPSTARILPEHDPDEEPEPGRDPDAGPDVNARVPRFFRPLVLPFDLLGRGFVNGVLGIHRWLERGILRQIVFALLLVGAAGLGTWLLIPKAEYLPTGNQNLTIAIILPPPGYNLEEMTRIGENLDGQMRPLWDVDEGTTTVSGEPAISQFFFVASGRQLFIGIRAMDDMLAKDLGPVLTRRIYGIPGSIGFAFQTSLFEQGLTGGRTIDIEIRGPDLHRLVGMGGRVMGQVMQMYPKGAQIRPIPSLDLSSPEVHILPLWNRTGDVGMSGVDLGYTIDALVDGAYAGDYFSGGKKMDLTIVGEDQYASRFQDLEDLPVATPSGNLVPLGSIANVVLSSGPEQINRRERERAVTIELVPPESVPLQEAVDRVRSEVVQPLERDGSLEGGYRVTLGGTADKLAAVWGELQFNLLLAVAITYLLMAALFESWFYPFVVILSVPLGAVGGLFGLWLLNRFVPQALDVLTMLGFVILVGTVVNNAILIVHQSLNYMRVEKLPPSAAVLRSVHTRMRPIFMTLFTTVFGLLPLVLFPGAGSELYRGIGSILIGGLFVSTIFTLLLIPTLFRLVLAGRVWVGRRLGIGSGAGL